MAEGWVECPALGPGWCRREAFRKSGATCGRTDTYYRSPTGEKFRSKIELSRFLGPQRDLRNFDFKNGLELPGPPKGRKGPKWHPPPLDPSPPNPKEEEKGEGDPKPEGPPLEAPPPPPLTPPPRPEAPPPALTPPPPIEAPPSLKLRPRRTRKRPPPEPPRQGQVGVCGSCQRLFPGVTLPKRRQWLCPECRAQRRDFNREQRFYKRVGCGSCRACCIPEDCGLCSACARGPPGPSRPKCLLRRCLRIVKKGLGCGSCPGCLSTEDCGSCCFCLRRFLPGLKRQWRCLRRRCLHPKSKKMRGLMLLKPPQKTPGSSPPRTLPTAPPPSHSPPEKWKPPPRERELSTTSSTRHRQVTKMKEKKKPGRPPKPPGGRSGGGGHRRCGLCRGCLRPSDCGRCDFCRDKPKFGGQNLKRQRCRWRQCLHWALQEETPGGEAEKSPGPPPFLMAPSKEEPGPLPHLQPPPGVLIAAPPQVKQEPPPPPTSSLVKVLPPPLVVLDESEEEEEEEEGRGRVPLPPPPPPSPPPSWPHTFLAELAEIPLPAHWGVWGCHDVITAPPPSSSSSSSSMFSPPPSSFFPCPPRSLRLVQRSPRSPMLATVVFLGPDLIFRVLVPKNHHFVPPGHEVLRCRPPRFRSVDDVVELLCDLESYGPCPGPPGTPPRTPNPRCQVLGPGGRCCRACLGGV